MNSPLDKITLAYGTC